MTTIRELANYVEELLESKSTPDYPGALNGLQLENQSEIKAVAAAVDFSTRAIKGAISNNANLLLVHHGMFWGTPSPFIGPSYRRLRLLMEHDIAVYSSHLPLDRHPALGNNVLLARELELEPSGAFAAYEEIFIGVSGESDVETSLLAERARKFAKNYGTELRTTEIPERRRTPAHQLKRSRRQKKRTSTRLLSARGRIGLPFTLRRPEWRLFTQDTTLPRRSGSAHWLIIWERGTAFPPSLSAPPLAFSPAHSAAHSAVRVRTSPGSTPLAISHTLDQPKLACIIILDVDNNSGTFRCTDLHHS